MTAILDHIHGRTFHGRHRTIKNKFSYNVDYIISDLSLCKGPLLFSRNKRNIIALFDNDYGSIYSSKTRIKWVNDILFEAGFDNFILGKVLLLAQPRVFNHVFNPVSFWIIYDQFKKLRLVIAEVSNTFGDRHSYLCHNDDMSEIKRDQTLTARKVFHVSPFQKISGKYEFQFDISDKSVGIWINFRDGSKGVLATFAGRRQPLTNTSILASVIRRPFGSKRIYTLIYWQAIKLKFKGAIFNKRPDPPSKDISR